VAEIEQAGSSCLILIFLVTQCLFVVLPVRASEDPWVAMNPMPTARVYLDVGVVNGKICAMGGMGSSCGPYVNVNEEYDPVTNS
jgi:hypothetical protein